MQVLLVTGGYDGNRLDSTELLLPSATSWTYSAALPSPRWQLRGATLNNKVVVTGTNMDVLIFYMSEFETNTTFYYTMQGAGLVRMHWMMYWNMTGKSKNGTRLVPCL